MDKNAKTARQAYETRIRFWRVCIVWTFFAAVLSANLYVGATVVIGNIRAHSGADTLAAFNKTGRTTRPLLDGTFCRNIVIDSKTSNTIDDRIERCDGRDY